MEAALNKHVPIYRATLFRERPDDLVWVGTYLSIDEAIRGAGFRAGCYQVREIPTGRLLHRVVSTGARILRIIPERVPDADP